MANPINQLTAEAKISLEAELKELLEVIEPDLVARVGDAASQGDLRENFAYHDLRRELGIKRGRIQELRTILKSSVIVEVPVNDGYVRLGSTVVVAEDGFDDEEVFWIVTEAEASNQSDSSSGRMKLSVGSPLGQVLLGRKIGDKVTFTAPTGAKLAFIVKRIQ
jgi:transcription elongation factor GreA